MQKSNGKAAIYISYAWGAESEEIAEAIEAEFQKRGLPIIRDKNHLGYKGRIKDFMEQIGRAKYVVLIIGNKYLHSINCMFELVQIFKNQHFHERIFPVVLDEVNIADPSERVKLLRFWENETENLSNEIKQLKDLSNIQGLTDDLNLNAEIRDNIARLTDILKDTNTLTLQRLAVSGYEPIYQAIRQKMVADKAFDTEQEEEKKLPVVEKDTKENENKKRRFGIIQKVLLAAVLLFALVALFRGIRDRRPSGEKIDPKDSTIIAAKEKDTLKQTKDGKDSDSVFKAALPNDDEPFKTTSNVRYDVELIVPSYLTKGKVLVDNRNAEIVDRGPISITVRLRKKDASHHFEVIDGSDSCFTDKLITKDKTRLTLCD